MTVAAILEAMRTALEPEKEKLKQELGRELGELQALETGGLTAADLIHLSEVLPTNKSITQLTINNNINIEDQVIALLINSLDSNTSLKTLVIRQLPTEAISKSLGLMLANNKTITNLKLEGLGLGYILFEANNMKHLTEGLSQNHALQSFILEGYRIDDAGIEAVSKSLIQNDTLISLNLKECERLTMEGYEDLFKAIRSNNFLQDVQLRLHAHEWLTPLSVAARKKLQLNRVTKSKPIVKPQPIAQSIPTPTEPIIAVSSNRNEGVPIIANDPVTPTSNPYSQKEWNKMAVLSFFLGLAIAALLLLAAQPIAAAVVLGVFTVSAVIGLSVPTLLKKISKDAKPAAAPQPLSESPPQVVQETPTAHPKPTEPDPQKIEVSNTKMPTPNKKP